ncbi:MAG: preprotein translocase subunit YajC [Prevotella sp.]|nr:preprotein translocase subunit YajC [Prevotella sp.]MDD7606605.1 preprotein translocase subunit YajC [Prevotellaceae bacterium]MDY3246925.1 preprotein translocase subunit YajC [Prevotella sp.]
MTTMILAAQAQGAGGGMSMIIMLVAIFAIMWLFMIRPQQKKQKEIRNFQNSLKAGDSVVTGGGIYGVVKSIDIEKNTVEVEIARGVNIVVDKSYVFANANSRVQ